MERVWHPQDAAGNAPHENRFELIGELPARNAVPDALRPRRIIWTDGACSDPASALWRKAAFAIYYGKEDCLKYAAPLPGHCQANQRAELVAVLTAVEREASPVEIRTDSEWTWKRAENLKREPPGEKWDHGGLWMELYNALQARPSKASDGKDFVIFTKIKAHCTLEDADNGIISHWI